ncbi:hypothetical protein COLO4_04262 [Corchorus olitorius]|uniref:Uncharacterized protein n=1 Tax=Corchorus olitorius TaxID=93759 RepID=A0A1R3KUP5_9ROSI|nr:hypothetical protein COLO4_04262 [Corchorus olitorius]
MGVKFQRIVRLHSLVAAPTSVRGECHRIFLDLALPHLTSSPPIRKSGRWIRLRLR